MNISNFVLVFLIFIPLTTCYSFPKQYDLILNEKNGTQVSSKEITANQESLKSILIQKYNQPINLSTSVFTKQKVSLKKGLNLKAIVNAEYDNNQTVDGMAIIVQNHSEGNQYIGDHGYGFGAKNKQEECAGLVIKATKANTSISFGNQEIFNGENNFGTIFPLSINLQIQMLENSNDEALLTFKIGTDNDQRGPTDLKLVNFTKNLCLYQDLSAFVGFSSSQPTTRCKHSTSIELFKIVEYGCGCPFDKYFPLKEIIYKKDFNSLKASEDFQISIENPKICNQCEDYQRQDRDIYLIIDYIWKTKGTIIDQIMVFQLPFIFAVEAGDKQLHLSFFLIDEISFGHKQFSIESNSPLYEAWQVPFVKPDNDEDEKPGVLLTGFSHNQSSQPPNIPPLDDKAKQTLGEDKFYQVDVYSRPIIQAKEQNSLFEMSNERIKIDSIKIPIENSDDIVQFREWIPTKEIEIQTNKYVLQGQSYEYEIKREDGSLIQLVKTRAEAALDTLYDGFCYGNYCQSFFCKKQTDQDNLPPISELDSWCKEMEDSKINTLIEKTETIVEASEPLVDVIEETLDEASEASVKKQIVKKIRLFGKVLSKISLLNDLYYIAKLFLVKCPDHDIECTNAKIAIVGKYLLSQISVIGKVNLFLDLLSLLHDGYIQLSKLGKWIKGKFTGDPHITNLDGCKFDFQGQGDFVLLEEQMIGLAIHSRFLQHSSFQHITTINSIAIRAFWGAPIVQFESLLNEKIPLIRVNGITIKIDDGKTFEIPNLRIRVEQDNYFIEFTSSSISLQITNHGYGFLWTGLTTIPAVYSRTLKGILGNGDFENNENDFQPGKNSQEAGYEKIIKKCEEATSERIWKFGQSWRLTKKEDSILFYKKEEDPNTFFDKNWKPVSTEEILNSADKSKQEKAQKECQQFKEENEAGEDFQNCVFDMLLFQKDERTPELAVVNAYNSSKVQLEEEKIYLVYKNVYETSIELEFGINNQTEKYCLQNSCNTIILIKKAEESEFKPYLQLQTVLQSKSTQFINGLDQNTLYTFKVQIGGKIESNLVSLYTRKQQCVPYCAKKNACGDDQCGGYCDKDKCQYECKFGVCQIYVDEDSFETSSNTLKVDLISLSVSILIAIILS